MKNGLGYLRLHCFLLFVLLTLFESVFFYSVIFLNTTLPSYFLFIAIGIAGIFMNFPIILYIYTENKNQFMKQLAIAESGEDYSLDEEYKHSTKLCKNIFVTPHYLYHKSFFEFYVINSNHIQSVTLERSKTGRGSPFLLQFNNKDEKPVLIGYQLKKTAETCLSSVQGFLKKRKDITN